MTDLRRLLIGVHHWDGTTLHAIGRAAYLIAFIAVHAGRINDIAQGKVTFTWNGDGLPKVSLEEWPAHLALPEEPKAA